MEKEPWVFKGCNQSRLEEFNKSLKEAQPMMKEEFEKLMNEEVPVFNKLFNSSRQ